MKNKRKKNNQKLTNSLRVDHTFYANLSSNLSILENSIIELNAAKEKGFKWIEACNKAIANPELSDDQLYEYAFKDLMSYKEYKNHKKEAKKNLIHSIELKTHTINPTVIRNEFKKNKENLVEDFSSKFSELLNAHDLAINIPNLDIDQMYELIFKNIMTKEQFQEVVKETQQELLSLGLFRGNDSKNNH